LFPLFAAGMVNTGGKFSTDIKNTSKTGGKICRQCCRYRWCTLAYEYLCELLKKFETVLTGYSGAAGKLIHEKNQKQKSCDTVPLNTKGEGMG
jgi:hypothetical protein